MNGPSRKELLAQMSESARFSTAHAVGSIDATDKIGSTIPPGMKRCIWYMKATSNDGSEQQLELYQGDATTGYDHITVDITNMNDQADGAPAAVFGGDPEAPFLVLIEPSASGTDDIVSACHETSAISVLLRYYDLPLQVSE